MTRAGRGYPSIDSLKEISKLFLVSIDDLLSGEKLITIAERENKSNLQNILNLLFGVTDLVSFALIVLPLYPKHVDEYVFSVNLLSYKETSAISILIYCILLGILILSGIIKILMTELKPEKDQRVLTIISMLIGTLMILLLAVTREAYAVTVAFILFIIKGMLLLKYVKTEN